jgi:beta-1,4-mannosyltransferase
MKSPLRVFMAPTFHKFNKYGPSLIRGIRNEGVDVRYRSEWSHTFPLFTMMRTAGLPEVVHLHWIDIYTIKKTWLRSSIASLVFLFELLLLKTLGVKLVWTVHDYVNANQKFADLDIAVRRLTVQLVDSTIVHTEVAKQELTSLYRLSEKDRLKITVIPHGHFIEQYPNTLSQIVSRENLGLDKDLFVFGFVGYLRPYKGVLELIQAFRQINGERLRLLIAGMPFDSSFGAAVKEAAGEDSRIQFHLRFIEDEELQVFLNAADVLVFPYTRSLTSGSLILAMSFSKAVIASDHSTIREVLPPEGGLVYATDGLEGLVGALNEIQTKDVVSMGEKNLKRASAYDWQSIAKTTVKIYCQATKKTSQDATAEPQR